MSPLTVSISYDPDPGPAADRSVVVVIDVIRAFTTAAVLLGRGAAELICVPTLASAPEIAARTPAALIVGEQRDPPFPFVDLPNSPTAAELAQVAGRTVVFCTVNGTRVLTSVPRSATVIGCAAVNISASAAWILANHAGWPVHLVPTDPDGPEDLACARHLAAVLQAGAADSAATRAAVLDALRSHERRWRANVPAKLWETFAADVEFCARVDTWPVVLSYTRTESGTAALRKGVLP